MRKLSTRQVCEIARELEGVTEKDHFGSDAFVAHGRIFATVWHDKGEVNLMLNLEQQAEFVSQDGDGFEALNNAWGRKGATRMTLAFVDHKEVRRALQAAWENSSKAKTRTRKRPAT